MTPKKNPNPGNSPARRALALLPKFPRNDQWGPGDTLRPELVLEVKEVASDVATYLKKRIHFIDGFSTPTALQTKLTKLEEEIETLNEKADKTDAQYTRLVVAERQLADLRTQCENASGEAEEADELLKQELRGWGSNLASALASVHLDETMKKACVVLQPWCGERTYQIARSLPKINDLLIPFSTNGFNEHRNGVESARSLVNLIEKYPL